VALAVALVLPTLVTWAYFIALDGAAAWLQQGAYGLGKTVQFALPAVWVLLVQRSPLAGRFLPLRGAWLAIGALFGLLAGAAILTLAIGVLAPRGLLVQPASLVRAKVASFGAATPAAYFVLALFYSAVHSLLEEYYWRWFVFGQLARGCRLPSAIGVSSVGFAAHHVLVLGHYFGPFSPFTWLATLGIVIGGAAWAWIYRSSGSLLPAWLSHAVVDAAIFAVGYGLVFGHGAPG
jgi:membrane protease YdiL (CAAX protease family)